MKRIKIFFWLLLASLFFPVSNVLGQGTGGGSGGGSGGGTTISNPLSAGNIPEVLDAIINFLLIVAAPIAIIMAIWVGFLFMTAGGNETKVTTGRKTLLYLIVGIGILILSKGIVNLVISLF